MVVDGGVDADLEGVVAAVVGALELGDLGLAADGPHHPGSVQRRLGTGVGEPDLVDGLEPVGDLLGYLGLQRRRPAGPEAAVGLVLDRLHDAGIAVADDHGGVVVSEVDVPAAVQVPDVASLGPGDEVRVRDRPRRRP